MFYDDGVNFESAKHFPQNPTMDSPTAYSDSPLDPDDIAYPCKGCGEVCRISRQDWCTMTADTDDRHRSSRKARLSNWVGRSLGLVYCIQADQKIAGNRWHIDCFRCYTCG